MSHRMQSARPIAAALAAVVVCAPLHAIAQEPAGRAGVKRSASAAAVVTTGVILGTAWRGDTTPFPQPRIRLRNVENGRGVARTIGDGEGRFRIDGVDPGAYVVELMSQDDKVLAVGDLFGVSPGTQSYTVVRLSARAPWFGGFFGNAAAAAIAAASTIGVTATGTNGRPVSPQ
jgi:hypothetical protein